MAYSNNYRSELSADTQAIVDKVRERLAMKAAGLELHSEYGNIVSFDLHRESIINVNNERNNVNNGIAPTAIMHSPLATPINGDTQINGSGLGLLRETNEVAASPDDLMINSSNEAEELINGFADDDEDQDAASTASVSSGSVSLSPSAFSFAESVKTLSVSMYDNGPHAMKGKKKSTRYKANLSLTYFGVDGFFNFPVSFASRRRDFKNTLPASMQSDPFYDQVVEEMDLLVELFKDQSMVIDVTAGKLRDQAQHVITDAAAIVYQVQGQHPVIIVAIGDYVEKIALNLPPKGRAKCSNQIAFGQYNHPNNEPPAKQAGPKGGKTMAEVMAHLLAKRG